MLSCTIKGRSKLRKQRFNAVLKCGEDTNDYVAKQADRRPRRARLVEWVTESATTATKTGHIGISYRPIAS